MNYKDYIQKNNINTEEDDMLFDLGNLVVEARMHAGISQSELAKRIGTKQPSIARVESGEVTPSIGFLMKIAKAVNTSLVAPQFEFMNKNNNKSNIFNIVIVSEQSNESISNKVDLNIKYSGSSLINK